jgi:hypothetical protein
MPKIESREVHGFYNVLRAIKDLETLGYTVRTRPLAPRKYKLVYWKV